MATIDLHVEPGNMKQRIRSGTSSASASGSGAMTIYKDTSFSIPSGSGYAVFNQTAGHYEALAVPSPPPSINLSFRYNTAGHRLEFTTDGTNWQTALQFTAASVATGVGLSGLDFQYGTANLFVPETTAGATNTWAAGTNC
jgi:hypothetical protein